MEKLHLEFRFRRFRFFFLSEANYEIVLFFKSSTKYMESLINLVIFFKIPIYIEYPVFIVRISILCVYATEFTHAICFRWNWMGLFFATEFYMVKSNA